MENVYLRSQMKITKNKYLLGFAVSVTLLAFVKMIFPSVAEPLQQQEAVAVQQNVDDAQIVLSSRSNVISRLSTKKKHRIRGVNNYREAFPDSQAVQIMAAEKWGCVLLRIVRMQRDVRRSWYMWGPTPIIMWIHCIAVSRIWYLVQQYSCKISDRPSTTACT